MISLALLAMALTAIRPPALGEPTPWSCHTSLVEPGVYAIVVGCSYQSELATQEDPTDPNILLQACESANSFAAALASTYGPSLHLALLTDAPELQVDPELRPCVLPPQLPVLSRLLNDCLPNVPEGSLVIFYFAGHGLRPAINRYESAEGELILLLQGSKGVAHRGCAISVWHVLEAMSRCHRSVNMVLLDCCHSGPSQSDRKLPWLDRLRHRGFMFGATTCSESTFCGTLTKAFISSLPTPQGGNGCRMPSDLHDDITTWYTANGLAVCPTPWFGMEMKQCIGDLREDATLLVFTFPRGLKHVGRVKLVFPASEANYDFSTDGTGDYGTSMALGLRLSSDKTTDVEFCSTGGRVMWKQRFKAEALQQKRFLPVAVVPEDEAFRVTVGTDGWEKGLLEGVRLATEYGELPGDAYVEAARLARENDQFECARRIASIGAEHVAPIDWSEALKALPDKADRLAFLQGGVDDTAMLPWGVTGGGRSGLEPAAPRQEVSQFARTLAIRIAGKKEPTAVEWLLAENMPPSEFVDSLKFLNMCGDPEGATDYVDRVTRVRPDLWEDPQACAEVIRNLTLTTRRATLRGDATRLDKVRTLSLDLEDLWHQGDDPMNRENAAKVKAIGQVITGLEHFVGQEKWQEGKFEWQPDMWRRP